MFSSAWCCLQTGGMQFVCGRVEDRETGVTHMSGGIGMAAGYRPSVHSKHKPKVAQTAHWRTRICSVLDFLLMFERTFDGSWGLAPVQPMLSTGPILTIFL